MTLGQFEIIGGFHFYTLRILIAFGFLRLILKKEIFSIKLNAIDKVLIAWLLVFSFLYVLFSGDTETINQRLGAIYNTIGIYFLVRAVVRDFDDVLFTVKMLALIILPLAVPFLIEYTTGRNPFYLFGGVPELSQIREGKLRCQGPFLSPILAGTFGATAIPLFVGLWMYSTRDRFLAAGAILAATIIVFASSSSGPLMAYLASVVGLICWNFKAQIKAIQRGLVILLLALYLVMNAPVWFLIAHLAAITGGSGWYRSALIDAFVRHFNEWWLIGTGYTAHWMPTGNPANPKMTDIVNHFVAQGVNGGLLGLTLFIWLIVKCFKATGLAVQDEARFSPPEQFLIWSMGCAVLSHVASFFSVSYFDQVTIFWYLIVGMIAVLVHDGKRDGCESQAQKNQGIVQLPT
jgi:hypothetical protein